MRAGSDTDLWVSLGNLVYNTLSLVGFSGARRATAFAQAGRVIPCFGTTHADYFLGEVPVTRELTAAEIAGAYEWETGTVILERFKQLDPLDCPAALVNRHAPFTWGLTVAKAVDVAVALECCALMALMSLQLAPGLAPIKPALLGRHFKRKHGPDAYYGQPG